METPNRRDFLRNAAIGSAAAGANFAASGLFARDVHAQGNSEFKRIAYRDLGSTGYKVSEIGFGAMNMRDPELVQAAIDSGINYVDTAHGYMNGVNEEVVGTVMKTRRKEVFLTTKIGSRNPDEIPGMLETSLKRLQTDHVDLVLLHGCGSREETLRNDIMKTYDDMRRKGMTRFVGVSTHNQIEVLDAAVESKFWEAVLFPYNYLSPPGVSDSLKKARMAGIATIGMKNLLNMQTSRPRKPLEDIREEKKAGTTAEQALIKWALNDQYLDTTIPGMTSFEHLADDVAIMGVEFTFDDSKLLQSHYDKMKNYYCCGISGCTGCRDKCPKGVEVNEINRCLGYVYGYGNYELAKENYVQLSESTRVDICSDCDECVVKCVNGQNLTDNIKRARELFT